MSSAAWAAKIFPGLKSEEAEEKLWQAIFETTRATLPDPVAAWKEHIANLRKRGDYLQAKKYSALHYKGPGTDLNFSIKGIPAVICGGDRNIPDGEVFTAPVKDSVEGRLTFNAPSIYQGTAFDGIQLNFKRGKIVEASSNEREKLNKILDSDAGARYIGEFSLGFNPRVFQPMRDILFDEKIAGSFHFTPGQAYEEADNGNRSQVHWDMVCIQRPEFGGGELYFDGKLIRQDGEFLPKDLRSLNRN